ncbi:hypothetical protein E2C01_049951 [Portunus trituberculatus]|uniref:Uncharacterized protein n=1 Tax=Portunus trituberculatus TaxID=210409 RepID=A0A5B7G7P7_PORTR|nr:hypothetical protein [Portunus trituberculatus]
MDLQNKGNDSKNLWVADNKEFGFVVASGESWEAPLHRTVKRGPREAEGRGLVALRAWVTLSPPLSDGTSQILLGKPLTWVTFDAAPVNTFNH